MDKKSLFAVSTVWCMIAILVGFAAYEAGLQNTAMLGSSQPALWKGSVTVRVIRNGRVIYEETSHNVITTIGASRLRDFLGFTNQTGPTNTTTVISLGNEEVDYTKTKLATEITGNGLARANGTVTVINATAIQIQHTWTATGAETVNATGLHWDATINSDGNMMAMASISSVSLQANDQLQVTWTVNIPPG